MDIRHNQYAEILFSCVEEKFIKAETVWEYHSLMRILSGEMMLVLADKAHSFGAGDTFLVPCNQLSTVIKKPKGGRPYTSILVTFRPEWLEGYYKKDGYQPAQPRKHTARLLGKHPLLDSYFASLMPYFELGGPVPPAIISGKLEEALHILRAVDEGADSLLASFPAPGKINLAEFMERNFMFNMPLEKFSRLTGRSIAGFNRDFRKAFQVPPRKWLMKKRLELAHYKITQQGMKPAEACMEAGFENASHFSFAFKKHFGYAPSEVPAGR